MRNIVVTLLVFSLSGFPGLVLSAFADPADKAVPILRHSFPDPFHPGETVLIEAIVDHGTNIRTVVLWYREAGENRFQKTLMTLTGHNTYEGRIEETGGFNKGIEYYIEAIDSFRNTGRDGSQEKPYFVEIRAVSSVTGLTFGAVKEKKRGKKPFWKKTWFWIAVAAAVGGGVAAAGSSGGGRGSSGTVIVE